MFVQATRQGFYGCLREEGDEFEISREAFSPTWMRSLDPQQPATDAVEPEEPAPAPVSRRRV